ncbi:unnamed protein product [Ectocarpus fasciculatus]
MRGGARGRGPGCPLIPRAAGCTAGRAARGGGVPGRARTTGSRRAPATHGGGVSGRARATGGSRAPATRGRSGFTQGHFGDHRTARRCGVRSNPRTGRASRL